MSTRAAAPRDLTLRELAARWWRPAVVVAAVALAVVWRLVRQDLGAPPNLELLTPAAFLAAALLRNRVAAFAPLAAVGVSDVLLGNDAILLFDSAARTVVIQPGRSSGLDLQASVAQALTARLRMTFAETMPKPATRGRRARSRSRREPRRPGLAPGAW